VPEEEAWVVRKAAAEGLSVQRFLVESALPGGRPSLLARRALYREFFAARRDLSALCASSQRNGGPWWPRSAAKAARSDTE